MDLPTDHFAGDRSAIRVDPKFYKGVVVFEKAGAPDAPLVQLGRLFQSENELPQCHICNQTGHLRAECPDRDKNVICRNCHETGHRSGQCERIICRGCSKEGHIRRDCPNVVCRKCGERGHKAKDCTESRKKRMCTNCSSVGHTVVDCDQPCSNCDSMTHTIEDCMEPNSNPQQDAGDTAGPAQQGAKETGKSAQSGAGDTFESFQPADKSSSAVSPPVVADNDSLMAEAPQTSTGKLAGSSGDEGAVIDNPKDAPPSDPPITLALPTEEELDVKFVVDVMNEHISSCSIVFNGTYADESMPDSLVHKTALVRFTAANICGEITVEEIGLEDEELHRLLSRRVIEQFRRDMPIIDGGGIPMLHHISLVVGACEESSEPVLLGKHFFTENTFGPFTPKIHTARDMLRNSRQVVVHFFTPSARDIFDSIPEINESINRQRQHDPLLDWHKQRKVNIQLGQQLPPEERPTYKIRARQQFDNPTEYLTVHFYNLISELEYQKEQVNRVKTKVRIANVPSGGNRVYFVAIEMAEGLNFRTDSIVGLNFFGADADQTEDWRVYIIDPVPFTSGYEFSGFMFRPRDGKSFVELPALEDDGAVIDIDAHDTIGSLAQAISEHEGVECYVQEQVPKSGLQHQINTLRHLHTNAEAMQDEFKMLLCNDFQSLEKVDFFAADAAEYGQPSVDAAWDGATKDLNVEQQALKSKLQCSAGSACICQGCGGTGKSTMIASNCEYRYRLVNTKKNKPCRICVVSPLNSQLDKLSNDINARLMRAYNEAVQKGEDPNYPVVIRRLNRDTEKKIYRKEAEAERRSHLTNPEPEYINDHELLQELLGVTLFMYKTLEHSRETGFDKRLQPAAKLSMGYWMLRLAGTTDADGEVHKIAEPENHKEFRDLLDKMRRGEALTQDDKKALTLTANQLDRALTLKADVMCMTPHLFSDARSHRACQPELVLHDEAGKANEVSTLGAFVWSKPYDERMKIVPGKPVYHILYGDIYQPSPVVGPEEDLCFHEQGSMSMFERFMLAGATVHYLTTQHRSHPAIAELCNSIIPYGRLATAPGMADNEQAKEAVNVCRAVFHKETPVVFLSTEGTAVVNDISKSTYNLGNPHRVMWIVLELIRNGVAPKDIGIGTPYKAQLALYITARAKLEEWCCNRKDGDVFRQASKAIRDIQVFTIDGIQGQQIPYLIVDFVISDSLKFVRDTARVLLAIGRARYFLCMVANMAGIQSHYVGNLKTPLKRSALYKAFKWCEDNRLYINMQRPGKDFSAYTCSFNVTNVVRRIYRPHEGDEAPIQFGIEDEFDLPIPSYGSDGGNEEGGGQDGGNANDGNNNDGGAHNVGDGGNDDSSNDDGGNDDGGNANDDGAYDVGDGGDRIGDGFGGSGAKDWSGGSGFGSGGASDWPGTTDNGGSKKDLQW